MTIPAKNARRRLRLLAVLTLVALLPAGVRAVVPVTQPPPTIVPVDINIGPGDQYDPHVSGEWAAYSSDSTIRYYNFLTGVDAAVPPPLTGATSVRDLLSDISGSRIVFSRIGSAATIMVFDAATPAVPPVEIDAAPGTVRIGTAIGGDTVAYIDFGLQARGELIIHDLGTSSSVRITNDTAYDQNPAVSPSGNVVAWEHCTTSGSNCDIWQAVKTGASWNISSTANSLSSEANPDTNGTLVVYDSLRTSESDIFWRAATGGAEGRLELPGFQQNPSIVGDFIAFENRQSLFADTDIFLYDIINNRLFQITDTPQVTEELNDVTVLPDGRLRVVWSSDEVGFDQRNIKGATFAVPNVSPTLSYSAEPEYGTDGISPDSGFAGTVFLYKVVYGDFDNQAPAYINVCIDGVCHGMNPDSNVDIDPLLADGGYKNGEQYTYSTTLAPGVHSYFFEASDGTATVRLPAAVGIGPTVSAGTLRIITGSVPDATVGVFYSVTITAAGGVPPYTWSYSPSRNFPFAIAGDTISGTATTAGSYVVGVGLTDAVGSFVLGSFSLTVNPKSAADQITDLAVLVVSFNVKQGIGKSLDAKLQNVIDALDGGSALKACDQLRAFINEVRAQSGKAITAAQATQLIAAANQVRATLGCP